MSVPSLAKSLGPLYSVIEARLSVFQDMLRLQGPFPSLRSCLDIYHSFVLGRLDLLVSQIDRRMASSSVISSEPGAIYREGEDDEEDDEDDDFGDMDEVQILASPAFHVASHHFLGRLYA